MPDLKRCFQTPFGPNDFRGMMRQPLAPFYLFYRCHGAIRRSPIPWNNRISHEPMSHGQACQWVMMRTKARGAYQECRRVWLEDWEKAARAYRRPDGPVCWAYLRVSHDHSAASGLSFEVQFDRILDYYRRNIEPEGVDFGPVFSDADVSARKHPLNERPGGMELYKTLRPGDHVVFYELDRCARVVSDFSYMMDRVWRPNRIRPHFVSLPGDPDNPGHVLSLNVIAAVAQFFSDQLSRKGKDTARHLRKTGRALNQKVRPGYRRVKRNGHIYLDPDQDVRTIMARIEHLRDVDGLPMAEVGLQVTREMGLNGNPAIPQFANLTDISVRSWQRETSHGRAITYYRAWKKILKTTDQKRPEAYQQIRDRMGLED